VEVVQVYGMDPAKLLVQKKLNKLCQ